MQVVINLDQSHYIHQISKREHLFEADGTESLNRERVVHPLIRYLAKSGNMGVYIVKILCVRENLEISGILK